MNSTSINQDLLLSQLKHIFPKEDTLVEVRKQSKLKYPSTGAYIEIDIFVPVHNIGFEFQDTYHYITTWYSQRTKDNIKSYDSTKRTMTHTAGINLIVVPCWWDGRVASLASTIITQRPDLTRLMPSSLFVDPISLNPPTHFFPGTELPDVGELMLASFPLNSSTDFVDSDSWWMGEKYDGVRFCWNPNHEAVFTRHGKELAVSSSVLSEFPRDEFIDGEFWFGRGAFVHTYYLLKGSIPLVSWHEIKAVTFDTPSPLFHSLPFEDRYSHLLSTVHSHHPFIVVVPRVECKGSSHLTDAVGEIIESSGEGSILRMYGSRYIPGRSRYLIKFKAATADKEGLVIGVDQGTVTLKLPDGKVFSVPPQNVQIAVPAKGSVVSFSYEINSRRSVPVDPVIYRIRNDVEWEDLLQSDVQDSTFLINNEKIQKKIFTTQPQKFWNHSNMREYLSSLARSFNLDPLIPSHWLSLPIKAVTQSKSGRIIMQKFGGFIAAVTALFPEVDLKKSENYHLWSSIEHRRKFFEKYAREHKFDPLIPENWYSQRPQSILLRKGASRVLFYHGHSVTRALLDIFPDIGLDKSKLGKWSWQYSVNRRQFFENYAKSNRFDPLRSENWLKQSRDQIMATTVSSYVVLHHHHLLSQALIDLFPDVSFNRLELLYHFDKKYVEKAKKFFVHYAESKGFDPLLPHHWYSQSLKDILPLEGAKKILKRHKWSLAVALLEVFPDIGLEEAYFKRLPMMYKLSGGMDENSERGINKANGVHNNDSEDNERKATKREVKIPEKVGYSRQFFLTYAQQNGFDPLVAENWYAQSRSKIMATKGAVKAVSKYKGSIARTLLAVFPNIGFERSKLLASLWNELKNRRKFFENYAKQHEFNPLVPDNWYSINLENIISSKGFIDVITHHKDSVTQALLDLFPEIGLDKNKMSPYNVWHEAGTRKQYFVHYAAENHFDPFDPDAWQSQPLEKILASKGAVKVVSYHQGKVSKALLDLFPDIGLHKSAFWSRTTLQTRGDRRKFFENYAKENEFDPLNPTNWYAHKEKLINLKGIGSVLRYHNTSLANALTELFPNIGLDSSMLRSGPTWPDKTSRRQVFEKYAKMNGFDPNDPESWYSQSKLNFSGMKRMAFMTLVYYKGNVVNALLDLFPDIGLDAEKLQVSAKRRVRGEKESEREEDEREERVEEEEEKETEKAKKVVQ